MLATSELSPYQEKQRTLLLELEDMMQAGHVLRVQRPDGKWGYMPMPRECPHCSGSGISLDVDLLLEGLCPECGGTGEV
jgi:DnaJ-class molecular chaperone